MKDLISVVVPVSNVENYLKECLDSILCQTYENLQVILVDDGSFDGTAKICDDTASADKRIVVVHEPDLNSSEIKNIGLSKATGKYVTFVNGGDYIAKNYIEMLHYGITHFETDIAFCKYKKYYVSHNEKVYENNLKNSKNYLLNFDEFASNVFCLEDGENAVTLSSWRTLFKTDIINKWNIKFDESITMWEDIKFLFEYLKMSLSYYVVDEYLYYLRLDENMIQKYNDNFITVKTEAYRHVENFVKDENIKGIVKFNLIWNLFYHELSHISTYYDKEKVKNIYALKEYSAFKIKTYIDNAKNKSFSNVLFMALIKMRMPKLVCKLNREKE